MRARSVRREIEKLGRRAPEYIMDVVLGRNVQVTTRQIAKELGGLDMVAVAPDLPHEATIARTTDTDLARVMQVNFNAHFFAVRAVADEFRRQGAPGYLVLVTRAEGASGQQQAAASAAAQGAVHSFVRAAGRELAPERIVVNGIAIGDPEAAVAGTDVPGEVGPLAAYLSCDTGVGSEGGRVYPADGAWSTRG